MIHFRNAARSLSLSVLGASATPSTSVHILAGHRFIDRFDGAKNFRSNLKYLSKISQFCSLNEAIQAIDSNITLSRPMIAFTFDDGLSDIYQIANILEEFDATATFFINPAFTLGDENYIKNFSEKVIFTKDAKPLSLSRLFELNRRGFTIGAHTIDHCDLSKANIQDASFQLQECKKVIEESFGCSCKYFAWPYGTYKNITKGSLDLAVKIFDRVFSSDCYSEYYGVNRRILNRRHFEPDWPLNHVKYFLSKKRFYPDC